MLREGQERRFARPLQVDVEPQAPVGLDISPTQYLRHVRLRHVHRDLLTADPSTTKVGEVAARWGFLHQGCLAAEYRQRYGLAPAETLRSRPYA